LCLFSVFQRYAHDALHCRLMRADIYLGLPELVDIKF
jgi:hypothetical protein